MISDHPRTDLALPRVSVIMPMFEQAHFIGRALESLMGQTFADWEAIIVDDGSRDGTAAALAPWLADPRLRCLRHARNEGLGRALNTGLDAARGPLVAYLPGDDVWYRDHLASLVALLEREPGAVLAYSGLRYRYNRTTSGATPDGWLQLVQCLHRQVALRWLERADIESDDLGRLFWTRLACHGDFAGTGAVSCEWVDHPSQRHKLMREPLGGINPFRSHYRVAEPLRFHASTGNPVDEVAMYADLRGGVQGGSDAGLKIVLAGELAYNPDRVLALRDLGHRLHGLWTPQPYWFNTVGPLPFDGVDDLPREGWREALAALEPDLIYAQLNWQAVPFAHALMLACPSIPFVWHFKEGPFICLEKGSWPQLADLCRWCDGCIYSSPEMRDWFRHALPGLDEQRPSHVLDGDLPRAAWFDAPRAPLLSSGDGELHTVVPGRPIGLHPDTVGELARHGIHLHFYGEYTQGQWREWIAKAQALAPRHLHLHGNVDQRRWVEEFSRYDAGWLHVFRSANGGEIRRADWDDLNLPARMATLAMAGLPMIQRDNRGAIVAAQALAERLGIGVLFDDIPGLARQLRDRAAMAGLREQVWRQRRQFCFDEHAPALVGFLREVIAHARDRPGPRAAACQSMPSRSARG
jgi:glycosyltransferase involved in cell wall biosynthesis